MSLDTDISKLNISQITLKPYIRDRLYQLGIIHHLA